MKLKFKVIIPIVIIISASFIIYFGFYLFPHLIHSQQNIKAVYIAPYISHTHSCHTHSPSCTGELPNQLVNYTISVDNEIEIFWNEIMTEDNGFFHLNLEINTAYVIQMKVFINETLFWGSTNFSTFFGSANCITTGQLKN